MNTSSFISGVLIGAAATAIVSKNKGQISSAITQNASKMVDIASIGSLGMNHSTNHSTNHSMNHQNNQQTQYHSKDESMKQINDFIKSNPDVKKEVDMILKETNSVIPGL
ncbi:hypothetical protein [Paenibacillus sp.]|uniref:hypothetical protein n=1 Tax=Paenibacillus sp. TaxID=58172 RepID=UPI0028196089|nr:hypothetical protein [Paenibacillus sp.]MDR0269091.1 hypothetical protein [Paenibacillus sp.]